MHFTKYLDEINAQANKQGYLGYLISDLGISEFLEDFQDGVTVEESLRRVWSYDEVQANLNAFRIYARGKV